MRMPLKLNYAPKLTSLTLATLGKTQASLVLHLLTTKVVEANHVVLNTQ